MSKSCTHQISLSVALSVVAVQNAWAHADFGSGEMVLRYGDAVYELWFNQERGKSATLYETFDVK